MKRVALVMTLVGAAATAACGGAQFDFGQGDGGPQPDGGAVDAGDAGHWSPVCPDAIPRLGSACTTPGLTCEYGDYDPDPACVDLVQCNGGTWQKQQYYGECPPRGPNAAVCAPTFEGNPRGGACAPAGTDCRYPQGDCRCEVLYPGPFPYLDGGAPQPTWHCDDPPQGCPIPRPRAGSACTGATACMYRECDLEEDCHDGYWQMEMIACAAGGARGAP